MSFFPNDAIIATERLNFRAEIFKSFSSTINLVISTYILYTQVSAFVHGTHVLERDPRLCDQVSKYLVTGQYDHTTEWAHTLISHVVTQCQDG